MSGGSSSSSSSSSSGDTNARNITLVFDECHTRVQTVSELLLISCVPRPVFTTPSDLALIHDNFDGFRDRVIGQLNKMLLLSREVATQSHSKSIHWRQVSHRVKELTTVTVSLLELSAHISYLMAVKDGEGEGGVLANPGPVDSIHRLTQADLDIRFSCQRLKRSRINDLQPHLLVRKF
ncbi:mesoderm development candidate 1 [Plakobranchus ocellatus]|uniref:Mesoderm development candidate 1 n=1 Tax=Plakobranchus ocellatus TaxID=259542 RepID=A0AAV4CLC0_9GAST|nr:mesoderm development candidate 1 [Plakobranchus ocellatus]